MREDYWIIKSEHIDYETKMIANEYLKNLRLINKSPATINKYRSILEKFFIATNKTLEELDPEDVLNWIRNNHGDKKERTVDLYLSALSSFFKYCLLEEYIDKVLIKQRWKPKIPKSLPKFLTAGEVARVKMQAEKLPVKYRALLELMLSSGCRCSEISNINIENMDLEKRTVKIMGKGKKVREVDFSVEAALLIKDYLEGRKDNNPALFLNKFGSRLGNIGIYYITTKIGRLADLEHKLNPHKLRHTFGTTMLRKGAEIGFIGDILGQRDLNTTRNYARVLSEDLISEYNKKQGSI